MFIYCLFTDTECTITNVVVDEYIECTVAADPEYMTSDFEGNVHFLPEMTKISYK